MGPVAAHPRHRQPRQLRRGPGPANRPDGKRPAHHRDPSCPPHPSPASASAITKGEPVLVLGTTSNTTITTTQITVEPAGSAYTASSATVIPFQQGAPTTSRQAGQIPAAYTEGSGTIVSGTTADKATEAALAAYPGGLVDRVVKLSNGEYEVHYIGVNWPHHVFVSQDFKVAGAD